MFPFCCGARPGGQGGAGAQAARTFETGGPALSETELCRAPSEFVESELFGYARGAFTGSFEKTPGKFEFANGGTILLDEIGHMDFKLQAKLLQVLPER